ncbi:EAL domain-containing protein [Thiohalospira sp.]|uniref:EAL domain-containing protein n=1 Tax=Thiohalospira sp. TaxID=3080549 RepID=UPI00397EB16A
MSTAPRSACPRCERLPDAPPEAGRLWLWPPLGHTLGKLRGELESAGLAPAMLEDGRGLCVGLERPGEQGEILSRGLSRQELADTRALFVESGREPGLADYGRVTSLARFLAYSESGWLIDLLREERLTVHFQPMFSAADPEAVVAHEALMRGLDREGGILSPGQMLGAARDADLLFPLDLAARRAAIQEASRHAAGGRVFINFSPASIYDPEYCLRTTMAALEETDLRPEQLVFEIIESDRIDDVGKLRRIVDTYRAHGCGVALDDIGSGYSSLNILHQLRPDFIKLDMELVRDVDSTPYKAAIARKVLELATEVGVPTIAEGVETAAELEWVRANGASLIQGFYLSRPGPEPWAVTGDL